MRVYFARVVNHEKLVMAVTICLVLALGAQLKFCRARVAQEAELPQSLPEAGRVLPAAGATNNVAGVWEMSVQKRKGGAQTWTLTLAQQGETLSGVIKSEGGDMPVTGTIKDGAIKLTAKRFGFTVEFPATFDGETMTGTMRALTVTRQWTAKRKQAG